MTDFLKIDDVLNYLHLKDNMKAAEFGCGAADFAVALAKKLKNGKVYAMDIQEEKLSALKNKININKLSNLFAIHCDLEEKNGSGLPDNFLDLILIPNVLFQSEDKSAIIKEGARILKSGGEFLVIDWAKKGSFNRGISLVNPAEIKKIARKAGFILIKEFMAGDWHFALLFNKE